jgi:hypothetical protein
MTFGNKSVSKNKFGSKDVSTNVFGTKFTNYKTHHLPAHRSNENKNIEILPHDHGPSFGFHNSYKTKVQHSDLEKHVSKKESKQEKNNHFQ